jgi:hypothetical protein
MEILTFIAVYLLLAYGALIVARYYEVGYFAVQHVFVEDIEAGEHDDSN